MTSNETRIPSLVSKRPFLTVQQAVTLAQELFNFKQANGSVVIELDSYDDRCYLLKGSLGEYQQTTREFVFKILNYYDSINPSLLEGYMAFMQFVNQEGFTCPAPAIKPASSDKYYVTCKLPWKSSMAVDCNDSAHSARQNIVDGIEVYNGQKYNEETECVCALWMIKYIPGKCLHEVPCTARLLSECGQLLARLHRSLKKFLHCGLERPDMIWSLQNVLAVKKYTHVLGEDNHIKLVEDALNVFSAEVLPHLSSLEKQVIHGDWNEHNIIISQDKSGKYFVSGFIDIADAHYSYRVFDIAIAIAYIFMLKNTVNLSPIKATGHFLAGYHAVFPISKAELNMLPCVVAARFCQILVFGAFTYKVLNPGNEYLLFSSKNGWKTFQEYWKIPMETYVRFWRNTCD